MSVPLLSVFFEIFIFLFYFYFLNNFPHRNGPLLWLCNYKFWGAALYTKLAHLKVTTKYEMITTSMGSMKSFNSDRKKKIKTWQCIVKRGIIIWFDVSLWHKYETTCQHAELAQIIFKKKKRCLKCLHKPKVVKSAQCYSWKKLDF